MAAKLRLLKFGTPLVAFVIGAALGAWLTGLVSLVGLLSIGVPTVVVAGLTGMAMTAERRARA